MRSGITIGDRYLLKEQVGLGGMGEVWRAVHIAVDRPVAIKIVRSGLSSDMTFAKRFRREAKIAASLDHPGITTVYDLGEDAGRLFVVMEWLDGNSLDEVVERNPDGLPFYKVLDWGKQIAEALAYAHARNVVHRDIKPGNLLLKASGTVVKVCDFGIARSTESTTITLAGQVLGTPAYMAPEQWRGGRVDGRADLYSLGCVVYELLTGRPPFPRGQRPEAFMYQHLNEPPTPPQSIRPSIPHELDKFVLRLLAKDPDDRPSDATAVAGKFGVLFAPPTSVPSTPPSVLDRAKGERASPKRAQTLMQPTTRAYEGTVKWFNAEKGYGFITPDGGGPDVFVHYSVIETDGYRSLEEKQRVVFSITQGPRGPQAEHVSRL